MSTRNRSGHPISSILTALLLCACGTSEPAEESFGAELVDQPSSAEEFLREELVDRPSSVVSGPDVDFHAHLFNAHHLPIYGIVSAKVSRWWVAAEWQWLLPRVIGHWMDEATCPSGDLWDPDAPAAEEFEVGSFLQRSTRLLPEIAQAADVDLDELDQAATVYLTGYLEGLEDEEFESEDQAAAAREEVEGRLREGLPQLRERSPVEKSALVLVSAFGASRATIDNLLEGAASIADFAAILAMCEGDQLDLLRHHLPADHYVHHMMDLDSVYDGPVRLSYSQRLDRIAALRNSSQGKLSTFIAFDPFRHEAHSDFGWMRGELLRGAVGVKFYPPSGYRPVRTEIPPKPWFGAGRRQHEWRYARFGSDPVAAARQIDAINEAFFEWVEEEAPKIVGRPVPIFSHHTPSGFQAWKEYGKRFGDPCYWSGVLHAHPRLVVVLAHSGGHEKGLGWFSDDEFEFRASFAYRALKLCTLYENAYCDFGYFDEVLRSGPHRQAFSRRLEKLILDGETADPSRPRPQDLCGYEDLAPRFSLRQKLLYGSDWMMVVQEPGFRDLPSELGALVPQSTRQFFFGNNAKRLLGL